MTDSAKQREPEFLARVLELLSKTSLEELTEFIKPYQATLEHYQTHDKAILNRLFPEVREVVQEMVALLEGKAPAPKNKKQKAKQNKATDKRKPRNQQ